MVVVDRRMGGLVLLILVVFAAVTVPHLDGRRTTGSPVPAVVPSPPRVGDCVTSVSALPPTDADTPEDAPVNYPFAFYGTCTGDVIGQVMSLDDTIHPLAMATISSYQLAQSACDLVEVNYVGSIGPFDPATITIPSIAWQAAVVVESISVGPTELQRAGGKRWTACLGVTPDRLPYRGQIRNALTDGVLPPIYATCWRSLKSSTEQQIDEHEIPCSEPHYVEVLATTQIIEPRTTPAQITKSCLGLASRALRTTDPTRHGQIQIQAYSMDGFSVLPLTAVELFAGYLGCIASVSAPRRLTGTLIGIGSKPLPLTG